jgi:hypothetical protein
MCTIASGLIFVSCQNNVDEKYITSKTWEHGGGVKVGEGDFIHFVPEFATLRGDTIVVKGIPKARIIALKHQKMEMHIRSLGSDSVGFYINTEEFEK